MACIAIIGPQPSNSSITGIQEPPPVDTLIAWLDDPSKAWLATAWLQRLDESVLTKLLAPGRIQSGPHGRFTPRMLALAKRGDSAIPAIAERLMAILRSESGLGEAGPIIQVLGAMGPASIPALVEAASSTRLSWIASSALEKIVSLEPIESFGQESELWVGWRPQDNRLERIALMLRSLLPRIQEIIERDAKRSWLPQSHPPHRPAAYLLARWGTSSERTRGLEVLDALARADEPFHISDSATLLHRLRAPGVAMLLRQIASRIPDTNSLKDQCLLRIGIALFQIGDPSFIDLVGTALRSPNLYARIEAIRFAGRAGDLRLVRPLIDKLRDSTETGHESGETVKGRTVSTRETVADVTGASLRRLTFKSTGSDSGKWLSWWKGQRRTSYRKLLSGFGARYSRRMISMPIWEANSRLEELAAVTDPMILPMLRAYIDRRDLDSSVCGPGLHCGGSGMGPFNLNGPRIVTLLWRFAAAGNAEGRSLLERAMHSVDPDVRHYAAVAVGSYDRGTAIDRLAQELVASDRGVRNQAADLLLAFDDARGIPSLIDQIESDHDSTRRMACHDLRLYTQQPLPCDPGPTKSARAAHAERWRQWWNTVPGFRVKGREAALDRLAFPEASPISFRTGLEVGKCGLRIADLGSGKGDCGLRISSFGGRQDSVLVTPRDSQSNVSLPRPTNPQSAIPLH